MKKALKIYHAGPYECNSVNGIYRVIHSYAQLLADKVDFHTFTFINSRPIEYYSEEKHDDSVTVYRFGKTRAKQIILPKRFINWLADIPKDAIFHLHGPYSLETYAIAKALTKLSIQYVFTPHDPYDLNSLKRKYILKRIFLSTFEKYVLKNASTVHALNELQVDDLLKYGANRVVTVPNTISDPGVSNLTINDRMNNQICFVGRLDIFTKGIDLLLQAIARLKEIYPKPTVLRIIGGGKSEDIDKIKNDCEKLSLELGKDVILLGRVSEEEKISLVKNSQIYLHLSRYEGFGLSTLEALAMGVPVVISEQVPLNINIDSIIGGYKSNDVEAAAESLVKILSLSQEEYEALSNGARQVYEHFYSNEAVYNGMMNMYNQVYESHLDRA